MNGKAAVFTAIGLVLGLLAGLAIGSAMGGEPAPLPNPVADFDNEAELPRDEDSALEGGPDKKREEVTPEPMPENGATIAELLKDVSIPAVPSGSGEITGRVLTEAGKPLEGVTITCSSDYPEDRGGSLKTAEERIAARMRYEKWIDAARRTASTGADGAYRLSGLGESTEYTLSATLEGWEITRAGSGGNRLKPGDTCDFTAAISLKLEVTVYLPDGKLAQSGRVTASIDSVHGISSTSMHIRGGMASLSLKVGKWSLRAESGDYNEFTAEPVNIEVKPDEALQPLELHLKATPGIAGTVEFPKEFGNLSANVYLQVNPPAEAPDEMFDNDRSMPDEWVHRGKFNFRSLAPGNYRLLLVCHNRIVDWADVSVSDAHVVVALAVPPPRPEDYIVIRAYGPDGELLTDVVLYITLHSGNGSRGRGGGEVRRPDGSFWLSRNIFGRTKQEGESWYTLKVEHSVYGYKEVRYEFDDTHDVDVRFVVPATAKLTVANFNDHPLREKLRWSLKRDGDDGRRAFFDDDDETGRSSPFSFGPEEPGAYFLVLLLETDHYEHRELYRQPVTLVAGENTLTALVPSLYTLTIVKGDVDITRVDVRGKDTEFEHRGYRSEVKDGRLVIEGVPPGTYILETREGGMEVVVNRDTEVVYAPLAYDCLALSVEVGGVAEDLGLRDGDKLIGIDGEEFESAKVGSLKMQTSLALESTTWTVLRGGVRVDVTFNGRELFKALNERGDGGLNIKPAYRNN